MGHLFVADKTSSCVGILSLTLIQLYIMLNALIELMKSYIWKPVVLELKFDHDLPKHTNIYQLDDGTIFYHRWCYPTRLYVKSKGKEIDANLPNGDMSNLKVAAHGNALYFLHRRKIFRTVLSRTSDTIIVTYLRNQREFEEVHTTDHKESIIMSLSATNDLLTKHVYRMCDDPKSDGIPYKDSSSLNLATIHRGCAIYFEAGHFVNARKVDHHSIIISKPGNRDNLPTFSTDSSPFFYFADANAMYTLNTHSMELFKPLHVSVGIEIIGVHNGVLTAVRKSQDKSESILSAQLPIENCSYDEQLHRNVEKRENMSMNDSAHFSNTDSDFAENSEFHSKFTIVKFIGNGGYGCVFKAFNKLDSTMYAVKRIPLEGSESEKANTLKEVRLMARFNWPGIVRYNNSWIEEPPKGWQKRSDNKLIEQLKCNDFPRYPDSCSFLYIQMEFCKYTLEEWLSRNKKRDLEQMKFWFKQLVAAVDYIHSKKKIHRDLKPRNILIGKKEALKFCDLGIVADCAIEKGREVPDWRTIGHGNLKYMAPEQHGFVGTSKVDVFALGLILIELCVAMNEEQTLEVFATYRRGERHSILSHLLQVDNLVVWMTSTNEKHRPDCRKLLQRSFLSSVPMVDPNAYPH